MNAIPPKSRAVVLGPLLVLAVALLVGCGSEKSNGTAPAAVTRSYVGAVQGSPVLVGVVVDGSRVLAYVCDGVPADPVGTAPGVQAWWNGTSDGRTVDLAQPAGRLRLELTDTKLTGSVSLADGRVLSVAGQAAIGDAGLYRAEASSAGTKAVAGWILAANGDQRGGVGTDSGGTIKLSGTKTLILSQPVFTLQGLATARIAKVGITPIPIP